MKILIAPDSFKGTMTSAEAAFFIEGQLHSWFPDAEMIHLPIGDGGEGTSKAIESALASTHEITEVECGTFDPLRRPVKARYSILKKQGEVPFAIIESAAASGLTLIRNKERDVFKTDSYGTGVLIADAINRNVNEIYVCMGGTATCDAGLGAYRAILSHVSPRKEEAGKSLNITLLCDVKTPLCGAGGAAYIFGPQKGATPSQLPKLDKRLAEICSFYAETGGKNIAHCEFSGAAGGLAGMLMALYGAIPVSGIDKVLELVGFSNYLSDVDLVVTGEGRADASTLEGKAASGILDAVKSYNASHKSSIPVLLMPGCFDETAIMKLEQRGFVLNIKNLNKF